MEQCWKCIPTEHLRLKESKKKNGKGDEGYYERGEQNMCIHVLSEFCRSLSPAPPIIQQRIFHLILELLIVAYTYC